ncbi:hypothetical protein EAZG_04509 [Escherichia coli TA249]|nr:hypothetical protein EAZG_04509 [Escherichia coli TA249]
MLIRSFIRRPIHWTKDELRNHQVLTDEIQKLMTQLCYVPCTTAVKSSQSNGIAERFAKTMKENCIAFMLQPNARTALYNLAETIEHCNKNHPHSTLGYRSPREYLQRSTSNGLSDSSCLEIQR